MKIRLPSLMLALSLITSICRATIPQEAPMKLSSPDFGEGGNIPERFTCEGRDITPTLKIDGVPKEAKSLALIVDDPDAPGGGVTQLFPVFSREPGKPKTYVQEAIKNHSGDVWRLLQREAVVFVCGEASHMAPDVRQAFAWVFQEHAATTAADAQAWLTGLVASHRYLEDIWASAT
jgi:Phosphatidylethanolamine-binding protein